MDAEEKFWKRVRKTDGCWFWMGARSSNGYGHIRINGKEVLAHRYSYELNVGPIGTFIVMHKCDNPPCVRPEHLMLGTASDNMRDAVRKGRRNEPCGEGHYLSKLTDEAVVAIRQSAEPSSVAARRFGVSASVVKMVRQGKAWNHVLSVDIGERPAAAVGESNASAKLTEHDVIDIRSLHAFGARGADLARVYGVSQASISLVIARKTWRHVP